MVGYRRNLVPGGTYFFTATLADRYSTMLTQHVDALRASVRTIRHRHPFQIDAAVILPDHFHIVMTLPDGDFNFSTRLQLVKRGFTDSVIKAGQKIERYANGEYALWQRRFWEHTIRDERDFETHVDYVHFNPVKHGLVTRVSDWPYSSFHRYVKAELLPDDWAGDASSSNQAFGERAN